MEDKIKTAFESVHMGEACAESIMTEMNRRSVSAKYASFGFLRTVSVVATALALIVLIAVGNADVVEAITANFTKPTTPRYYSTKYYNADVKKKEINFLGNIGLFVNVRDGRLYFVANGENIDITDRFSDDVPFEYFFMDENGFLNYFAIGGAFGGTKESLDYVGYQYHIWYPDLNGDGIYNDGGGGGGRGHYNRETDDYYEWHKTANNNCRAIDFSQRETE